MKWIKKGLIFAPNGRYEWNKTHAQVPTVDCVSDNIWRIYYSSRDEKNISRTSYIEVEAGNPSNILYEHPEPILPLGRLGTFDECGIMPCSVVTIGKTKYFYYLGWTVGKTISYHLAIGLAISHDEGKTFVKVGEGPLLGTTLREPYFTLAAAVMLDGDLWRIWYGSTTKWEMIDGRPEPFYHIKYAESNDGVEWDRRQIVAVDYRDEREGGVAKPTVIKDGNVYRMWFTYRSAYEYRTRLDRSYRIGYAESIDGVHWKRLDELAGIDVSREGWDSEMICYPFVVQHQGRKFMFYNGNKFGTSGIGYAILDE